MYTMRIALAAVAALAMVVGGAFAQEDLKQEAPGPSSPTPPEVKVPSVDGFVVIEEEEWTTTLSDEPEKKLEDAMAQLRDGDPKAAAHDLDKAATYTKSAATRSEGHVKDQLLEAARQLNAEADALRGKQAVSPDQLTAVFARALQALAQHHAERAGVLWLQKKTTATGQDLRAAALDVGYAQTWADMEPDPRIQSAVNDAQQVASLLIASQPADPDRVLSTIEDMQEVTGALEEGVWPESSSY